MVKPGLPAAWRNDSILSMTQWFGLGLGRDREQLVLEKPAHPSPTAASTAAGALATDGNFAAIKLCISRRLLPEDLKIQYKLQVKLTLKSWGVERDEGDSFQVCPCTLCTHCERLWGGFSQPLCPCSSGEMCRNSSEREGLQTGSQSRATYSKWKHWKIKPEFCLGPYGKFVFDSGICTDLLVSAMF